MMPFDISKTDTGWTLTPRLAPDFEERVVAFLDILGFTDLVRRSTNDEQARVLLRNVLLTIESECGLDATIGSGLPLIYSQGSDSIIISCPARPEIVGVMLMRLQLLQGHLLSMHAVLCRGGVTVGPLVHAGNVFYGPAYLEALALEESAAMPMIAISEPVMKLLEGWPECFAHIRRDVRGVPFIDYFWSSADGQGLQASGFTQHRAQIERLLSTPAAADERVRAKYDWLVSYFNAAVKRSPASEVPLLERRAAP
ncbi:MAG: hypothetical protein JO257_24350 [Deltaproteobacteria bacterium]|nr:hypothetical protein [Deltaproteobacteria bacterium]